jgi:hypothetical protein
VKNSDTAGSKGYDAGKKISGIKRHLAVDTQGLPHAVAVTTADVSDRTGTVVAFERREEDLQSVISVLAVSGQTTTQDVLDAPRRQGSAGPKLADGTTVEMAAAATRTSSSCA